MNFVEKGHHLTVIAAFSIIALFACSFAASGSFAKLLSPQHQSAAVVATQADGFDGLVPPPPPPPRT